MAASFDEVVKGLNKLNANIETLLDEQRSSLRNSSGNNNYVSRRRYFGDNDFEKTKQLRSEIATLEEVSKRSGKLTRLLGDFKENSNNLKNQEQRLRQSIEEYKKTQEQLKRDLNKRGLSDAEALKEVEDKIDEINKKVKNLKEAFDGVFDPLVEGLDGEKVEEILDTLKEKYQSVFDEKTGADKVEKLKELAEELNEIGGFDKFNIDNVKTLAANLRDSVKEEENLEKYSSKVNKVYEKRIEQLNEQVRLNELSVRTMKDGFHEIGRGFSKLKGLADDLTSGWRKVDQASSNFAKNIGVGNRGLVALRKNTIDMVKNGGIGLNYGIGMEELVEIQQNYAQATGRNIGLTTNDVETSAAMSRLMGAKGGEFASALENFGLSYSEAGKRVGKMFATASKYGLSFEKYSQNFLTNIKLAQNYTFRDGLRGLERMAQKSTAIKLDMQQIASFADKVSTLQGAVESSASLQVLGGPFAQFADPLGMLNEGLNNMEGLMDRFQNMTQNLGKFNAETGQVEVSAFNKQRVRAAAQAMGMDYNQVMESIQAQGRRKFIEDNIKGNFTDEEKEFLMNTATVQNGKPQMTYIDSKGQRVTKDVDSMNSNDIKQARAQSQSDSDNIKDIAKSTRSFNEKVEGIEKTIEAIKAGWVEGSMNWINNKLNDVTKYLGAIKFAVAAIAIGKGISAIGNFAQGGFNIVNGITNFKEGAELAKAGYSGLAGKGGFMSGFGAFSANMGGSLGPVVGAVGSIAVAVGVIAAVVKGIHDVVKGKEKLEERDKLVAKGKIKKGDEEDRRLTIEGYEKKGKGYGLAGGAVGGAVAGALIGSAVPIIGTAIGAIVGGAIGYFGGKEVGRYYGGQEIERRKKEAIAEGRLHTSLERNGFDLRGGYTEDEYKKIISAINNGGDNTITKAEFENLPEELRKKMQESGDVSLFGELQEFVIDEATLNANDVVINAKNVDYNQDGSVKTKANGGLLNGPSHANGGMPIIGSNIEVEGGEFVVNKHAAKQNLGLLTSINKMGDGGIITPNTNNINSIKNLNTTISKMSNGGIIAPREDSSIKPIKVLPITNASINSVNKTSIEPININISGTIKLDGGNGKEIDMNALLKDPTFIRNITNLIEQQMIYNTKGARYTDKLVK